MKSLSAIPSLTERVYGAILDEILDGTLRPGEHLVQEQLAENLGVSRQPIQQAMVLLKADGLVEEIGKRGVAVARLDLTRMRHHYDVRALFDAFAAAKAAEAVREGRLRREEVTAGAQPILAAGKQAIKNESTRDLIHHDEALHALIYKLSGNAVIAAAAEPNWRFLRRAMAEVLRHAEPPHAIWRQHQEIVDAVCAGDVPLAGQLARDHIVVASKTLSNAFAGQAWGVEPPDEA